ncbi:MAG: DUF4214 domain-containing protein [Pseudomonadota bacterium]
MADYFYVQVHTWYVPSDGLNAGHGHAGISIVDSRTNEIVAHLDGGPEGPDGVINLPGDNDAFLSALLNDGVRLSPGQLTPGGLEGKVLVDQVQITPYMTYPEAEGLVTAANDGIKSPDSDSPYSIPPKAQYTAPYFDTPPFGSDPVQNSNTSAKATVNEMERIADELGLPPVTVPDFNAFEAYPVGHETADIPDHVYIEVKPGPHPIDIMKYLGELLIYFIMPKPSPLVLDLDGDGVELTSLSTSSAYFDLDINGFAELSGWVAPDDGVLAIDLNGDGYINNGSEVFGDQTGYAHGFLALDAHDLNADGVIDTSDAVYQELIVWTDLNGDGVSQTDELKSLTDFGIIEISLAATASNYQIAGNDILWESTFSTSAGVTSAIVDAFFETSLIDTKEILPNGFEYHQDSVVLPRLSGMGEVSSITAATTRDSVLRQDALDLVAKASSGNISGFLADFEDFLYRWAGVENVASDSRGDHVNAQSLEMLEVIFGQDFVMADGSPNPEHWAAADFDEGFGAFTASLALQFLSQTAVSNALLNSSDGGTYEALVYQNPLHSLAGDLSDVQTISESLFALVDAGTMSVADAALTLHLTAVGTSADTSAFMIALQQAASSDGGQSAQMVAATVSDLSSGGYLFGDALSETLGNTESYADSLLIGNAGNDTLIGGRGENIYLYSLGDGSDIVRDYRSETGKLVFADVTASEATFGRSGDDMTISFANGEVITVDQHFDSADTYRLDEVAFADGSSVEGVDLANRIVSDMKATGTVVGSILSETYYHTQGDGSYTILDHRSDGDKLIFTDAVFTDTVFARWGDDLVLTLLNGEQIRIIEHFDISGTDTFDLFEFSGGETITALQIPSSILNGGAGDDTIVGYAESDLVYGLDGGDNIDGGQGDDQIYGGSGQDDIFGGSGNDTLFGGADADYLAGGQGGDRLFGGAGSDTLYGENGAVDRDQYSEQVFRLYQATLDRAPDGLGHTYWTNVLENGSMDLGQAVIGFMDAPEFQTNYGATDNAQFVTLLYNNVLERAPDPGALPYWTGLLDSGMSRSDVVLSFIESPEFKANTAIPALAFSTDAVQGGFSDDVFRLYHATLDRDPDTAGVDYWTGALANGMSKHEAVSGFVSSAEFQSNYGATDNAQFVSLLYNNVLGREPGADGLSYWVGELDAGMSRNEVVLGLADSAEFITLTTAELKTFMRSDALLSFSDELDGGAGSNVLIGGIGADYFKFDGNSSFDTTVVDFEAWDFIVIENSGYGSIGEAAARFSQVGGDAVFSDAGQTITFLDASVSDLIADDTLILS